MHTHRGGTKVYTEVGDGEAEAKNPTENALVGQFRGAKVVGTEGVEPSTR